MTNDLARRVYEHRQHLSPGFTSKYNVNTLVFYEKTGNVNTAIEREKQIKGWSRAKKNALVESLNPKWEDLARDWY
jgi:putative endonuclease